MFELVPIRLDVGKKYDKSYGNSPTNRERKIETFRSQLT